MAAMGHVPHGAVWDTVPWTVKRIIARKILKIAKKNPNQVATWAAWASGTGAIAKGIHPQAAADLWRVMLYLVPEIAISGYLEWEPSQRPRILKTDLLWLFQHKDKELRLKAATLLQAMGVEEKVDEKLEPAHTELKTPSQEGKAEEVKTEKPQGTYWYRPDQTKPKVR